MRRVTREEYAVRIGNAMRDAANSEVAKIAREIKASFVRFTEDDKLEILSLLEEELVDLTDGIKSDVDDVLDTVVPVEEEG